MKTSQTEMQGGLRAGALRVPRRSSCVRSISELCTIGFFEISTQPCVEGGISHRHMPLSCSWRRLPEEQTSSLTTLSARWRRKSCSPPLLWSRTASGPSLPGGSPSSFIRGTHKNLAAFEPETHTETNAPSESAVEPATCAFLSLWASRLWPTWLHWRSTAAAVMAPPRMCQLPDRSSSPWAS